MTAKKVQIHTYPPQAVVQEASGEPVIRDSPSETVQG
jgi:hypothetical protein